MTRSIRSFEEVEGAGHFASFEDPLEVLKKFCVDDKIYVRVEAFLPSHTRIDTT